jgi:dTDP-4-dehydrorhamnose reductase
MTAPPAVLILGATGRLGRVLAKYFAEMGLPVTGFTRAELDLEKTSEIRHKLEAVRFDWLINAAGTTDVDQCERDPQLAHVINTASTAEIARACAAQGARMLHISTDYVFDGLGRRPLREADKTNPVNQYGATKLAGEQAVLEASPAHVVARVSWLFGGEKETFPDRIIASALAGDEVCAVNDKWASPTFADDLADWLLFLVQSGSHSGLIHLCNAGVASWQEYGQAALDIALELGVPLRARVVTGHSMVGFDRFLAKRPVYTPLKTTRFAKLYGESPRQWQDALWTHLRQRHLR